MNPMEKTARTHAAHMAGMLLAILLVGALAALALAGCSSGQQSASSQAGSTQAESGPLTLSDRLAIQDTNYGGVYIDITIDDFNQLGFAFGDSVDVTFSNGYKLENIPYYNGFYANPGDLLLVGYPGYPHIKVAINYGDNLWEIAGLSEGDTATVTLREAGAYLATQEALDIIYTDERSDYSSDEAFANFRACAGGSMKQNTVYRSASPIDNEHNRAPYVEELMKQANVLFELNLSDSPEEAADYCAESKNQGVDVSYYEKLRDANCVAFLDLSASYPSDTFAQKLADGLTETIDHDGPYLVHCVEGKDRTGFVCLLLEALCGATYDEMKTDYMITYDNYYGINLQSDPDKYDAIASLNFDGMASFLAGVDDGADLASIDYREPAREYLRKGGMSDELIDMLVVRLTQ